VGQYFIAVNLDKKEYFDPWSIGGVAKLWEWCVNNQTRLFPFLLRKSCGSGGGDYPDKESQFLGRWAGDRIVLIGDYDDSGLYKEAMDNYVNIACQDLVDDFNAFIEVDEYKLEWNK